LFVVIARYNLENPEKTQRGLGVCAERTAQAAAIVKWKTQRRKLATCQLESYGMVPNKGVQNRKDGCQSSA